MPTTRSRSRAGALPASTSHAAEADEATSSPAAPPPPVPEPVKAKFAKEHNAAMQKAAERLRDAMSKKQEAEAALATSQEESSAARRQITALQTELAATKQDLLRARKKGGELLEEAGTARRTLKNAEQIREQEVQETKCKQDWYEHRVSALECEKLELQGEVAQLLRRLATGTAAPPAAGCSGRGRSAPHASPRTCREVRCA